MERHVLSILVENHAGVLSRVSGLFSRRGYNIESLSVGITEDPSLSRITIVSIGDKIVITQIKNQLEKLIDVKRVVELGSENSVCRELALIKISVDGKKRHEVISIAEIFRANIVDVANDTMTIEMTGEQSKISAFIDLVNSYGIKEIVRTGLTGLERGSAVIKDQVKFEEEYYYG